MTEFERINVPQSGARQETYMSGFFNDTHSAFRRYFEEKVVSHLWAATENQLFGALQIAKRNSA